MKSLRFPLMFLAGLMVWNFSVGQSIIMKADTVPFGLDSTAVLKLPEYRGVVNWQVSYDKTNWSDILQTNRDSILVDKEVDAWYRAEVSDGTCNKVYSDTVIVQKSDTFEITPFEPLQDIHGSVVGEPVKVIFNNDTIVCLKDSNKYIFQGDIVFTEDELIFMNGLKGASIPVWSFTDRLWPNRTIYYRIHPNFLDKQRVTKAISHWEYYTRLQFIEIEDATDHPNFIEFVNDPVKTNSRVGMVGGPQQIRVAPDCDEYGVRHEIGHAIGLHHEHSRIDRDKYIIVHEDNIIVGAEHNYVKFKNSFCLGDFDYVSLMLYPNSGGFARDPKKVILERKDGVPWQNGLVQRKLSEGDKAMVEYLYSNEPFVKTAGVTDFKDNSAICGGTVYNDGGSIVTERGICWNTTGDPKVVINNTTKDGSGTGSFASTITNIEPNKTYYVRAYAKNRKGISYGNQITFVNDPSVSLPTVISKPIDVRIYYSSSAALDSVRTFAHGQVVDEGGSPVLERGVCWNNSNSATTADETKVDSNPGTGNYIIKIAEFIDWEIQYSLRAYASNKKGTSYGEEILFSVNQFEEDFPSIRTNEVTAVTGNSAKCGGIISTGNVSTFSSRGIFYSTYNNPTVTDQVTEIGPGGNGSFEVNLTGLESGKLYYARAFAVTERGTLYGSVVSFTTSNPVNYESEPNDDYFAANSIQLNQKCSGTIGNSDEFDWFKFTPSSSVSVKIRITNTNPAGTSNGTFGTWYVYHSGDLSNSVASYSYTSVNSYGEVTITVKAGETFYLKVNRNGPNYFAPYAIETTTIPPVFSEMGEPNGESFQSTSINLNSSYSATVGYNDAVDWYSFIAPSSTSVRIRLTNLNPAGTSNGTFGTWYVYHSGDLLNSVASYSYTSVNSYGEVTMTFQAGETYFLKVTRNGSNCFAPYTMSFVITP